MRICEKIDEMLLEDDISDEVRKYLNDVRDDTCGENPKEENQNPILDLTENYFLNDP